MEQLKEHTYCIVSDRDIRKNHHVAYNTVRAVEDAIVRQSDACIAYNHRIIHIVNVILKKFSNLSITQYHQTKAEYVFYIAMDVDSIERNKKALRRLSKKGKKVCLYCFDTWESKYSFWDSVFEYIEPYCLFLAYKQSADYFSKKYENVFWLPQSADDRVFYDYGQNKNRLFMQMGRKNQSIHQMILDYMSSNGIDNTDDNYMYEKVKGQVIIPNTIELAKNINSTKYFVCAPQCKENAGLTGNISEVTARFYEAMACKTMIIGYKPQTFDLLFDEDAMVDLEKISLEEAIKSYEQNPEKYTEIVERNYQTFVDKHTWDRRVVEMIGKIQ